MANLLRQTARGMLGAWALGAFLLLWGTPGTRAAGPPAPVRIKLATLIPRGTPPYEVLLEMREKWRQAPEGGVEVIVYPDGTMGGEADMVRRMRVGQIQAAMLSVTGLSEIDKSVNALQNMPMMFRSLDAGTIQLPHGVGLARCRYRPCSNSANTANIAAMARPLGVVRSRASVSDTKPTPR